jgi:aminopeptidase
MNSIITILGGNLENNIRTLARNIVNYSIALKPGEKVLIETRETDHKLVIALIEEIYNVGGYPYVNVLATDISKAMIKGTSNEHMSVLAENKLAFMKQMDAYISIRGIYNFYELSDVPKDKMQLNSKMLDPVQKERVKNTKWVILVYPTPGLAQAAKMSSEKYMEFYFKVCNLDYSKMDRAMESLVRIMDKTDKVRLVTPNTDITFSIKGIPAIKCAGRMNIPDGEVFTAPVRDSVNGYITYNLSTTYNDTHFSNVRLEVANGKIVKATADRNIDELNSILDTDENSRYFGEFAIGVNPYITEPFSDILFDEKMTGSIHFTPGSCYENEASNGNVSAIHWDMVLSMLPQHGGGEIYFDDKLIRKDGLFVIPQLKCLNPKNLI